MKGGNMATRYVRLEVGRGALKGVELVDKGVELCFDCADVDYSTLAEALESYVDERDIREVVDCVDQCNVQRMVRSAIGRF
jgi:hypothetical protein